MPFGSPTNTARVSTGNVRTTYDPITAAQTAAGIGVVPGYVYESLVNPLGTLLFDAGGTDGVSGTTTQLPIGQIAVYKYVLYKSTTNPAVTTAPGVVYYTDNTGTVVSGSPTDGLIGATTAGSAQDTAGIMMVNATDLTTLTATLLNNGTNGSGVWICIGGFVKAAACTSAQVAGDNLYGQLQSSGTQWTPFRLAAGGAVLAKRALGLSITSAAQIGATGVYTADTNVTMGSFAAY